MSPKRIAQVELTILALGLVLFLWWTYPTTPSGENLVAVGTTTIQVAAFPDTPIEARSAEVYDVHTGKVLFQKDAFHQQPLASLTKLMSALTASQLIPNYLSVRIDIKDIKQEGDSGLFPNEIWPSRNLVDFSLITSSNDGIHAIAIAGGLQVSSTSTVPEKLFVDKMNQNAQKLGLHETYFVNESGLDLSATTSGAYGSARDIVHLMDYILKNNPHMLEATSYAQTTVSSEQTAHAALNTNKAIAEIPFVLASKTGYTDLSGGNVVVAFSVGLNHPVIISVLGSSYDGRFSDLEALVKSTLTYLGATNSTSTRRY
jgi:D-alanyl-D-alanine carboxypeptidase